MTVNQSPAATSVLAPEDQLELLLSIRTALDEGCHAANWLQRRTALAELPSGDAALRHLADGMPAHEAIGIVFAASCGPQVARLLTVGPHSLRASVDAAIEYVKTLHFGAVLHGPEASARASASPLN